MSALVNVVLRVPPPNLHLGAVPQPPRDLFHDGRSKRGATLFREQRSPDYDSTSQLLLCRLPMAGRRLGRHRSFFIKSDDPGVIPPRPGRLRQTGRYLPPTTVVWAAPSLRSAPCCYSRARKITRCIPYGI